MDIILDSEYIDTIGEDIDPKQVMSLENQEKQVLIPKKSVEDPRKTPKQEVKKPEIFEQRCIIPELHPMKSLPALSCNENIIGYRFINKFI